MWAKAELARYVLEYFNQGRLLISSHTNSRGTRASNQAATQRRADVFEHYLESKGVSSGRIQVKVYGENKPVKTTDIQKGQRKIGV